MFQTSIISVVGVLVAIVLIFVVVTTSMTLSTVMSSVRAQTVVKNGYEAAADVVNIGQTGVTLNNVPMMRIDLRIHHNGASWDVTIKQFVDLGNIPRIGERVRVMVDPSDNSRVMYMGLASGGH